MDNEKAKKLLGYIISAMKRQKHEIDGKSVVIKSILRIFTVNLLRNLISFMKLYRLSDL